MPNEIFIENLPLKVDASMLVNIFKREGRIISCSIDVDKHLASLGKGRIVFDNPSSAYHAVKIMDGQNFHGVKIRVSLKTNDIYEDETEIENYTKVFVKNIPPHWDDYDLMVEFKKFGDVKAAQISMTKGKSNYFGFVIFNKPTSAKAAVMSKYMFLIVKPYLPKPMRNKTTSDSVEDILRRSTQYNNLHVKNIPEDMDDSALEELFEKFGTITSVKVAKDQNSGKSLKFGFVGFVSEMDAEEARSAMNGYILNSKQLVVSFNQKKEARKQYLDKRNSDAGGFKRKNIKIETERKEINIDGKEKDVMRNLKYFEQNEKDVGRKETNFDGKEKNVRNETCSEKKEKVVERKEAYFEKKEKRVEKPETNVDSKEKVERKDKGFQRNVKGIERKEKNMKRKGNMRKETVPSKP